MSELVSTEDLSPLASSTTTGDDDDQPRKYLRRNHDVSIGVTTRSRQREQDKKTQDPGPSESMANESSVATTPPSIPSTEQCAICMENFTDQEVGIPENCEHAYCLSCITEWAKKNNSCPVDRKAFRLIMKKSSFFSSIAHETIPVKDHLLEVQLEDDFLEMIDDDISCRVCGRDDQEDLLLICDECGNGYHTFCLELAGVPDAPEWMCPLCEVDQLSANEDLYDDSDLEELQHILFDESMIDGETDLAPADTTVAIRQPRVRQTARMRTSGVRHQPATLPNPRPRRRQRPTRRRRTPAPRQPTLMQQQRQRQTRERRAQTRINRRIETVNSITRNDSSLGTVHPRAPVIRNEGPRLSIYDADAIAFEDEPVSAATTAAAPSSRLLITPSEAARRIAASGIPISARHDARPSISRELSMRRATPALDRVPTRSIRPPAVVTPRLPISQLPRIQRRADASAPSRRRSTTATTTTTTTAARPAAPTTSSSFLDHLLNSQERLHSLQNVRMHGPHIQI